MEAEVMQSTSYRWICQWRLLIGLLIAASLLGCTDRRNTSNNRLPNNAQENSGARQSTPTPENVPSSEVSRRNANVSVGAVNQSDLQPLTDNDWHKLHDRDRIATDADGEAELNIINCMRVYVFRDSELMRSACPKSNYESGSVTCAAAGTSLFNNSCGSKVVIQTGSADITLEGTYLSVTYLPSEALTLIMVLKGKVRVQPITNFGERTLGEAIEVNEGNLWLSAPDDKIAAISNLDIGQSRKPQPLGQLQTLIEPLKLRPWIDRIAQQAKADGISMSPNSFSGAFTNNRNSISIDCDCASVSAGLLTRSYQNQCKAAEQKLKEEYQKTGKVTGKCDSVASGPKATPR